MPWRGAASILASASKNTGDERRRTHDLNTAAWIPDLFMKRLREDGYWTLFSPSDTPDLHDLYGKKFEARYAQYEALAGEGKIPMHKKVRAAELWKKHLTMLFETGHPWITWKDPSNIRSPQDHVGVVHSSNLCTEITLNTSETETAVCNLGSINMAAFIVNGKFDRDLVARVVPVAMRMLDNVVDVNFYPTEKTKRSNMKHRPVGLGLRGLQDALYKLGLNFDSDEAVRFSDESQETISYHAILSSALLAKERGTYETYKGSKWDRGIMPQDTLALLEAERGMKIDVPRYETLDWRLVREIFVADTDAEAMRLSAGGMMGRMMGGGMMGPGMMDMMANCPMMGGSSSHAEGRIAFLKAELAITDAQKPAWEAYAAQIRKNLQGMQDMQKSMMAMMAAIAPPIHVILLLLFIGHAPVVRR